MTDQKKAEQILDQFDIRHAGLELMIEEALNEARSSERDRLRSLLERRLALARRAYDISPHKTYMANVINTFEELLDVLEGSEEPRDHF